jgi:hypothetical protein
VLGRSDWWKIGPANMKFTRSHGTDVYHASMHHTKLLPLKLWKRNEGEKRERGAKKNKTLSFDFLYFFYALT